MRSITSNKQTEILKSSDTLIYHRRAHNQYCGKNVDGNDINIKVSQNDANNNNNCLTTRIAKTQTVRNNISNTICKSKIEKYSLRQRHKRSLTPVSSASMAITALKTSTNLNNSMCCNKNSLIAVSKCINTSDDQTTPIPKEKAKHKAAPLSKYRRKTANARERTRMREINSAFENLRRCVPHTITGDESTSSNEKLTKITTLRLAMKYIQILSEALNNPAFQEDFLLECKNDGDHRFTTLDWVQPALIPSEKEVQLFPTTAQTRCKVKKSKLPASKTSSRRQKTKVKESVSQHLTSPSPLSSSLSSSSSSAYASMSTSPLLEDFHSSSDLNNMILESDGESLHLSEPCLSPLNRTFSTRIHSSLDGMETLIKNAHMSMISDNPLELSLRLLETDNDTFEFSTNQQPSMCISPLATLEVFNPFGDLLQSDLPENAPLDLFLT